MSCTIEEESLTIYAVHSVNSVNQKVVLKVAGSKKHPEQSGENGL